MMGHQVIIAFKIGENLIQKQMQSKHGTGGLNKMAEYIEKEALVRILRAKAEMGRSSGYGVCFDNAAKMIELLPAADVAPVKRGEWVWNPNGRIGVGRLGM